MSASRLPGGEGGRVRGVRRVFVPEEWEGSPVAGRPASRQMADGTNKQKWRADFVHSERLRGEGRSQGAEPGTVSTTFNFLMLTSVIIT